jgi:hypothetical protein
MARSLGTTATLKGAFETGVYGVPIGGGPGTMHSLPFKSCDLGSVQGLIASDVIGQGRDPLQPILDVINVDGNVTVPVDFNSIGFWLKALFGQPIDTAIKATGSITVATQPVVGETITLNGTVWTFIANGAGPVGNQIALGTTALNTAIAIQAALAASVEVQTAKNLYTIVGSVVTATAVLGGSLANSYTLATNSAHLTLSGPTMTGGCWQHVYSSGVFPVPSFDLEIGHPSVPEFFLETGVLADSIALSFQRSGLANAVIALIAQGETPQTVTLDNAPLPYTYVPAGQFQGSVLLNGAQLANVTTAAVTYKNNIEKVETIRNDGKIDGGDPLVASLDGTVTTRFADMAMLTLATSGTPVVLDFAYTKDVSHSMVVHCPTVYLPKPKLSITGPGGVQVPFAFQAAKDPVSGLMCTVTLKNDVAAY